MTWSLFWLIAEYAGYWLACSIAIVALMNLGRMRRWLWARIRRPLLREPLDEAGAELPHMPAALRNVPPGGHFGREM